MYNIYKNNVHGLFAVQVQNNKKNKIYIRLYAARGCFGVPHSSPTA